VWWQIALNLVPSNDANTASILNHAPDHILVSVLEHAIYDPLSYPASLIRNVVKGLNWNCASLKPANQTALAIRHNVSEM
jgi:hypothetical protein